MAKKPKNQQFTLIGLDIQGDWNIPLLQNAAQISGALMVMAKSDLKAGSGDLADETIPHLGELQNRYDQVLACETGKKSQSIFDFPAPHGRTALIVGNELKGIPRETLNDVDHIVSIPMHGKGMSSVNVGIAAAIALYVMERDLARKGVKISGINHQNVDLLVQGPREPYELGSLFRSVWAFGWKKVFLSDCHGIWFTKHRKNVTAGRAASRREINPLVIVPDIQLKKKRYDRILQCNGERSGIALSRLTLPSRGRLLIIYGEGGTPHLRTGPVERVFVDYANSVKTPRFRHEGSILLSVISEMLRKGKRE